MPKFYWAILSKRLIKKKAKKSAKLRRKNTRFKGCVIKIIRDKSGYSRVIRSVPLNEFKNPFKNPKSSNYRRHKFWQKSVLRHHKQIKKWLREYQQQRRKK